MNDQLASVYGLKDTRNDEIFYVGMSIDPYSRYGEHLAIRGTQNHSAKDIRILDMRKEGKMPELIIFEQDIPIDQAPDREKHWILYHIELGTKLTNVAHGLKIKYKNDTSMATEECEEEGETMTQALWITAGTAAKILEERFGRPVRVDYVTKLGRLNRLRTQHIGSRIVLYNRNDVEQIQINFRKPKEEKTEGKTSTQSTEDHAA